MIMRLSFSAAALLAGLGLVTAQPVPAAEPAPAAGQVAQDQAKPAQNGAEEPGSHPPKTSTEVFVNGKLAVPGAPDDSQTVPSKFSERNARLDATPIMALPLGLSDEQKHRVADSVAKSNAPVSQISAKPADILPATTPVSEFSADVKADAPMLSDVGFIRTKDKILLVRAPNMVVTGEVATN
jgi:predicted component of type VI protein secretion system